MPQVMLLHSSKPLSISAIKTTGTLVVLCTRVLLCAVVCCCVLLLVVVVCCWVFLCVLVCCCVLEGWGGLLVAVLCDRYSGGGGWLAGLPSPSHYSVGIHGCLLVGGELL
jgi:hypothetical protein